MKELSIEEKAKAYDEALERAKEINNEQKAQPFDVMLKVFPELKESEDERIRKELIEHIKANRTADYILFKKFSSDDVIAWLEKQGEQKPVENKGMDLVEEEMTPFQKKVFFIVDTAIEEEQGLSNICNELLALAIQEIEQNPAWSEEDENHVISLLKRLEGLCRNEFERTRFAINEDRDWLKSLKQRIGG